MERFSLLLLLLVLCSCRQEYPSTVTHQVVDAWTRPFTPEPDLTTAIYLTINNTSPTTIQLTGASTAVSDTIEIHQSLLENGIMRMRPAEMVNIAPQSTLAFQPGGHHLMVKGLQQKLTLGDSLQITLRFKNGAAIQAVAQVRWE